MWFHEYLYFKYIIQLLCLYKDIRNQGLNSKTLFGVDYPGGIPLVAHFAFTLRNSCIYHTVHLYDEIPPVSYNHVGEFLKVLQNLRSSRSVTQKLVSALQTKRSFRVPEFQLFLSLPFWKHKHIHHILYNNPNLM